MRSRAAEAGPIPGMPGRGLGAVGDINGDGFADVLAGDADTNVQVVGAYAMTGVRLGYLAAHFGSGSSWLLT